MGVGYFTNKSGIYKTKRSMKMGVVLQTPESVSGKVQRHKAQALFR